MSIDGTHFRINEPVPFDTLWYSHKFNGPGLAYELGLCIKTGNIVWYNGPFPSKHPDISIFRANLKSLLLPGEKVVADLGYKGKGKARAKGVGTKQEAQETGGKGWPKRTQSRKGKPKGGSAFFLWQ